MYRITFSLFLLIVFTSIAYACTCSTPYGKSDKELIESALASSATVFAGRVLKIVKARNRKGVPTGGYNAVFEVIEIWKGPNKKHIRIFFSGQCCLCQRSFNKGKEYLVYASGDNTLIADTCSRTKELTHPKIEVDREHLGPSNSTAVIN